MNRELTVQNRTNWILFGHPNAISKERLIQSSAILFFLPFELCAAVMAIVLVIAAFRKSLTRALSQQPGSFFLYGFVFLQIIASLAAGNAMGLLNALGTLVVVSFAGLLCANLSSRSLGLLLKTVGFLSIGASIAGFFEFNDLVARSNSDLLFCLRTLPDNTRIQLTYHNPNLFATMTVFYVCINSYLFSVAVKHSERLLWLSAIVLSSCALILTGCRAALVPLPFILPLFLYFLKKKRWLLASIGLEGCGMGALLLNPHLIPRFGKMESIDARLSIWESAIRGIGEHPLIGGGPQYYQMLSARYGTMPAPHAHNLLLDMLLNSGLIGTAAILMYVAGCVQKMLSSTFSKQNPAYTAMVLSMIASILIEGLVDCTINFPAPALLLLVSLNAPCALEQETAQTMPFVFPFDALAASHFELPAHSPMVLSVAKAANVSFAMHSSAPLPVMTRTRDAPSGAS